MLNLTKNEIDALWDKGFRPFEVYTKNPEPVLYFGKMVPAGTIEGWNITHVFARESDLDNMPYFDCIIASSNIEACESIWRYTIK